MSYQILKGPPESVSVGNDVSQKLNNHNKYHLTDDTNTNDKKTEVYHVLYYITCSQNHIEMSKKCIT